MSRRYPGGLISKTPVTPTGAAAPGIWTLDQAITYIKAGTWPLPTNIFWIGQLGTGVNGSLPAVVAVDSYANSYFCGTRLSLDGYFEVAKYNSVGIIQSQKNLGDSANGFSINGAAVDSNNNVYVCGSSTDTTLITNAAQIVKYDSSGAIQWQRTLADSAGATVAYGVAVDSSANVYVCGYTAILGYLAFLVVKYNTSGVLQWQKTLDSSSTTRSARAYATTVDSSGNVYFCGDSDQSGDTALVVGKYNTSGVLQWKRTLTRTGFTTQGRGIATDSSGNVYVCGDSTAATSGGFTNAIIAKYDTSGAIQWKRNLGTSAALSYNTAITADSSGNVYVCGTAVISGSYDFLIAKYDTSGAIQWQRRLGSTANTEYGFGIALDSFGNMYVSGTRSTGYWLFAKLPTDGSLTGTYTVGGVSIVYGTASLTDSVSTLTDITNIFADAAGSTTDSVSELTSATTTLTSSVTIIS